MERSTAQDQTKRFSFEHIINPNEEDHIIFYALKLYIYLNGEHNRTTKQYLHLSILYLKMKRTTGPHTNIFI
jgi:hypothetical protein